MRSLHRRRVACGRSVPGGSAYNRLDEAASPAPSYRVMEIGSIRKVRQAPLAGARRGCEGASPGDRGPRREVLREAGKAIPLGLGRIGLGDRLRAQVGTQWFLSFTGARDAFRANLHLISDPEVSELVEHTQAR
jgi:hypothetical protein